MVCQWGKTQRFSSVFLCGLRKYHPGQNSKSALLFYKLVTRVWKDRCRLYANRRCPRFLSASRPRSAEKYIWHILSVSFINQRMRCWKAHSTGKPLPSMVWPYEVNDLPGKSWAYHAGSRLRGRSVLDQKLWAVYQLRMVVLLEDICCRATAIKDNLNVLLLWIQWFLVGWRRDLFERGLALDIVQWKIYQNYLGKKKSSLVRSLVSRAPQTHLNSLVLLHTIMLFIRLTNILCRTLF